MEIHKWFELPLNDKMSLANTSVTINVINICLKTVHTAILSEKKNALFQMSNRRSINQPKVA